MDAQPATGRIGVFFRGPQPAEEVGGFLRATYPSVPIWAMLPSADDAEALHGFVRTHALQALVIADVGPSAPMPSLREAAEAAGLPPWAVHVVEFGDAGFPSEERNVAREHAKALCAAKVERALASQEVPLDSLKPKALRLDAAFSRRDLLRSLAQVRYEVVPRVQAPRCKGRHGCTSCLKACPLDALAIPNGHAVIDKARCDGCGFCVKACPAGAIEYATFSPGQIDAELRGLLHPAIHLAPRIVAFVCHGTAVPAISEVLPLPLACVGMVSSGLIARAFDLGADGVAVIQGSNGCGRRHEFGQQTRELRAAQTMVAACGVGGDRLELLSTTQDPGNLIAPLRAFVERVRAAGSHALSEGEPVTSDVPYTQLGRLLRGIGRRTHLSPIQGVGSPLGILAVDPDRCTLCGLCAPPCPTEALTLRGDGGRIALAFEHAGCVACGLCCRACPEHALTLRRGLDPTRLQDTATLLEEEMARCRRCGMAFAPLKMCEKIRDLLARSGIPRPEYVINLCPSCRVVGGRPSALQDPCGLEHPRTRNEPVLEFSAREAGA